MKNKIITIFISSIIFLGTFVTGCNDTGKVNAVVWSAPSTVKYMLEEEPDLSYGSNLNIQMAKNEYESVQLIVTPKNNVKNYNVSVTDLTDGKGNNILSSDIEVYVEKYIEIKTATTNFETGFYPDAIVPIDLIVEANEDLIKKGQNQAFLITVHTTPDTVVGVYNGKVNLELNGNQTEVNLKVKVYDFEISSTNHTRTSFGFWNDFFAYVTEGTTNETINNYLKTMLKYRVSTIVGRIGDLEYDDFIEYYVNWLSQPECSNIGIPYTTVSALTPKGKSYSSFDVSYMKQFLTDIIKASTNENNLISKLSFSFSTYDEPRTSQFEYVCLVSETFQELKNELAEDITLFAPGVKDEVKEALKKIPCVTTTNYNEALARDYNSGDYYGVDTWCGLFDYYDSPLNRYYLQKQVEKGDGSWWYGCIGPTNPYPTYHIDDNLLSARLINWMMMDYSITGNLYWCANLWASYNGSYIFRDVWTEALAFPGANGDGYLIYPGNRYGLNDAIATIRLEAIRDGMEDYEYLYALKTLSENLAEKYAISDYDFNTSIRNIYRSLYNGTISYNNIGAFEMAKNQIMQMAEAAEKGILINYKTNYVNGKYNVDVYTENSVQSVVIEGESATGTPSGSGTVWSKSLFADSYIDVEIISGKGTEKLSRYVGGGIINICSMQQETDVSAVKVTDFSEYDGIDDVTVSLSDKYSENGNSMKLSFVAIDSISYQPGVTFNVNKDMSNTQGVRFSVYSSYDEPIMISVTLQNAEGKKETLTADITYPGVVKEVYFAINSKMDLTNVKALTVNVTTPADVSDFELYIDNLALVERGVL